GKAGIQTRPAQRGNQGLQPGPGRPSAHDEHRAGGHSRSPGQTRQRHGASDPLVAHDQLNGYYMESLGIVVSGGQPDVSSAEALVKRVNGAARALDPAFQTVQLRGRYTLPDGTTSVVLLGDTAAMRDKATAGAVVIDGVPAPAPPPK